MNNTTAIMNMTGGDYNQGSLITRIIFIFIIVEFSLLCFCCCCYCMIKCFRDIYFECYHIPNNRKIDIVVMKEEVSIETEDCNPTEVEISVI